MNIILKSILDLKVTPIQEMSLNRSLANDLVFHSLDDGSVILGLALDTGAVTLYYFKSEYTNKPAFELILTLQKHEDWVRCIDFVNLGTNYNFILFFGRVM
jgi:WD40 repeat protein